MTYPASAAATARSGFAVVSFADLHALRGEVGSFGRRADSRDDKAGGDALEQVGDDEATQVMSQYVLSFLASDPRLKLHLDPGRA